jgi:cytochrome c biogenesis protein CcmG, thiol:disulfide interchange protein DsbE
MRRAVIAVAIVVVGAAVVIGWIQAGAGAKKDAATATGATAPTRAEAARLLAGSPPALAALHAQANALIPGATGALESRLAALKGHPVVVNKWASWCGPCRAEFPVFQRVGVDYGRRVAFLGLNAGDNHDSARRFLDRFPVSYPSVEDPHERASGSLHIGVVYPITVFYRADGKRSYIHQGGYASPAKLEADMKRYALR